MTFQSHLARPPQMAAWLLSLFTPVDLSESIIGDLLEEFSGLAVTSGVRFARRWYWRQALRSVVHSAGGSFRAAPWLIMAAVLSGFWLTGFATRFSAHAMQSFLDGHQVYEWHPSACLFWLTFPLEIGRVLLCGGIGIGVALLAKRAEMVAVLSLVLVQTTLFLVAAVALIAGGRPWVDWFLFMAMWNSLSAMATLVGGGIVRSSRRRDQALA